MDSRTGNIALLDLLQGERDRYDVAVKLDALDAQKRDDLTRTGRTKIGRNDPCACGSGKKFKRCHLLAE